MTSTTEDRNITKNLQANLFHHLDTMYVMMPIQDNLSRLLPYKDKKRGHTYLSLKTEIDTKIHIWGIVKTVMTTAYQKGYKRGYNKGLIDGAVTVATSQQEANKSVVLAK